MITSEMIRTGLNNGSVVIVDSPLGDGAVCRIGEHWFYFGGWEACETTAAEYVAKVPKPDVIREIMDALDSFRDSACFQDEYDYYYFFLREYEKFEKEKTFARQTCAWIKYVFDKIIFCQKAICRKFHH